MAILAVFTGKGVKKNDYETLRKEVKWEQNQPTGAIFHAAGLDQAGEVTVADVWESQKALDEFVNTRLMPAFQKYKLPAPTVQVFTLHNANAFPQVEQFKAKVLAR